jgi:hypothetical protein
MSVVWRWGVGIWTAVVIVGGGLTLWLQDTAGPPPPAGWERTGRGPTPGLPKGWETSCPVPKLPPGIEDGVVATTCLVTTG